MLDGAAEKDDATKITLEASFMIMLSACLLGERFGL
jgi:hypothetical protein